MDACQPTADSVPQAATAEALVRVRNLRTYFPLHRALSGRSTGQVKAVDGVSFDVPAGGALGLVGESGCGKTTVGRTILRLVPATGGEVWFEGANILALDRRHLRNVRRRMQIIFQDPIGSLNPRMTVEQIVGEGLTVHGLARGRRLGERVAHLLSRVGLTGDDLGRYPHEFSGGQRQRIGIARALALEPRFIVCDEPVSALDVSIQAQILDLLAELRTRLGLSYLFIAHNLAVVQRFCDNVAVMYLGRIVEIGPSADVLAHPGHPYTLALLAAVPEPAPRLLRRPAVLRGEPANPIDPPTGCGFHPRCPLTSEQCLGSAPELENKPGLARGHKVACHLAEQIEDLRAADQGWPRS